MSSGTLSTSRRAERYAGVSRRKSDGVTYTPSLLADFVARQIVQARGTPSEDHPTRILDPALGHGELLVKLLQHLRENGGDMNLEVHGFETSLEALQFARSRLEQQVPEPRLHLRHGNFLEFAMDRFAPNHQSDLFRDAGGKRYDMIIANPPYVRTQIMGARQTQALARQFGLSGRLDLYYAFILAIARALKPNGTAGLIVSNRFMTVKSGAIVRKALMEQLNVRSAWDLGDTKLFDAAVLPAVLISTARIAPAKIAAAYPAPPLRQYMKPTSRLRTGQPTRSPPSVTTAASALTTVGGSTSDTEHSTRTAPQMGSGALPMELPTHGYPASMIMPGRRFGESERSASE